MVKATEYTVDGMRVITTQFGATDGIAIGLRVTKLFAPIVAGLFKSLPKNTSLSDLSLEKLMSADSLPEDGKDLIAVFLSSLAANIDEKTAGLFFDLLSTSFVNGQSMSDQNNYDMMFAGKYITLIKIALQVIKLNNFFAFGGIGNLTPSSPVPPTNG